MKTVVPKWIVVGVIAIVCGSTARGQAVGLQVADTAEARTQGDSELTAGTALGYWMSPRLGPDRSFFGVRKTYSVLQDVRVFGDLGLEDVEGSNPNFGLQLGALCSLPENRIADFGIRTALHYTDTEQMSLFGGNLMFISSDETLIDHLFVYGGLGVDISKQKTQNAAATDDIQNKVNPLVTLGALYKVTDQISLYAELTYLDTNAFVGFGLKIR